MSGLIHLYTGDGKGKTTAALGLALRFSGHGKKVVLVQLSKGSRTGELKSLARIPEVTVLRNSRDYGFWRTMTDAQKAACRAENDENVKIAVAAAKCGSCELLILDEITSAYENGAVDPALVEALISEKPEALELALTGRNAPAFMLEAADYISEIKCVRHPYEKGVPAREGAEL